MDPRVTEIEQTREEGEVYLVSVTELVSQYVVGLIEADELGKPLDGVSFEIAQSSFEALAENERMTEFRRILDKISGQAEKLGLFTCGRYINAVVGLIEKDTEVGKRMASDLLDFVFKEYGEKVRPRWINEGFALGTSEHERVAMMFILELKQEDVYLKTLAENKDDPEYNLKVGMLLKARGMPALANRLRFLLGYGTVSADERVGLEFLLRDILGYPELEEYYRQKKVIIEGEHLPLSLSLSEVYGNYDFSRYPVSLKTEEFRMRNLMKLFEQLEVEKGDRICDAGCGTGWLTGELVEAGFSNVTGFDVDPVNLSKAENLNPEVSFFQCEIEEMDLVIGKDKLDVVLLLGRTGTHAEDWDGLDTQMMSVNGTLEMGGCLVIDWPNPDVMGGVYEEYKNCIEQAYRRHGFSNEEMEGLDVVVDGPATATEKSKQVYNRLVPHLEQFRARVRRWGFELVSEIKEELPNGTGKDENVVMVLQKVEDFTEPTEEERQMSA